MSKKSKKVIKILGGIVVAYLAIGAIIYLTHKITYSKSHARADNYDNAPAPGSGDQGGGYWDSPVTPSVIYDWSWTCGESC